VTSPLRAVLDCVRTLPFADGLAVADSALRRGEVDTDELAAAVAALSGRGTVPTASPSTARGPRWTATAAATSPGQGRAANRSSSWELPATMSMSWRVTMVSGTA